MTLNKTLGEVFDDLRKNMEICKSISILIICAVIAIASILIPHETMVDICKNLITIFPSLFGFTIAALAILYTLEKDTITKLLIKANDGKIPFDVLFTSFTLSALVQLLVIILALVYVSLPSEMVCSYIFSTIAYLISFMSLVSLCLIFDIILHLFTIRSFIK